jgi:undecaprenyl-diphosphatase
MNNLLEKILLWDQKLFLYLNGLHSDSLDPLMIWISGKLTWLPFYVVILGFIAWHFRKRTIIVLVGIALTILFADQLASGLMKPLFSRLRPCHDPLLEGLVYLAKGCGGKYGFVSSHAANTFGVAMFLWLTFTNLYKWIPVMFLWAAIVSYSRIYLGVHYPLDIIVGGLVGIGSAWVAYALLEKVVLKKRPGYLRPLSQ